MPRLLYPTKQRWIIRRIFGSIGQYRVRNIKVSVAAKELGIRYATVHAFVRKYEKNLGMFPWPSSNFDGRPKKLEDLKELILSQQKLYDWRHMSLGERCSMIYELSG